MSQPWKPSSLLIPLAALILIAAGCSGGSPTSPAAQPSLADGAGGTATGGGQTTGGSQPTGGGSGTPTGGGGDDPAPPGRGTLKLWLTDAPVDEISELQVFVAEIKVKRDGSPVERFASGLGLVDLLTLQDGVTALVGQDEVEAGTYQFIELLLDESQSYVVEIESGERRDLKIPSEKIKVAGGPFEVAADGTTSVTVDFDAEKSLQKTGNGRYQLKPFVTITAVSLE